ncbi:MAG: hypothetical protein O2826_00165 [Chloroflexi bacterium]|nr:hypothetical protein [Chloroflexota bacterium]MDA1172924.1 hypothetical protein [Chloroflexota bacterium]
MVWCDHEVITDNADDLVNEARAHAVAVHVQDHEAFDSVEYGLLVKAAMREVE